MKNKKNVVGGIIVLVILAAGITALYQHQKQKDRYNLAARIADLGGRGGPPPTIEALTKALEIYEEQIEAHVRDAAQTGVYWKILAVRLQDKGLHHKALEALERAIYYTPEDQNLQYRTGVSAAAVAKGYIDFSGNTNPGEGNRFYTMAETAYLKSIAMDPTYSQPHYGLGVLYVFELNRPEDAIPHLERYLELTTNNVDGMFVLAAAYYLTGQYELALNLYDRILTITKDTAKRAEAERNRQTVMDAFYG
jgi:tetratricopeptide (TPR) repeat protein